MRGHIQTLAILHIIHSILLLGFGVIGLMFFGGLAALAGQPQNDAQLVVPILGMAGGFIFAAMAAVSLPKLIAGIGLLYWKPWARTLMLIISVLGLLEIPVGTALGIYGLWALTNRESLPLFHVPATG